MNSRIEALMRRIVQPHEHCPLFFDHGGGARYHAELERLRCEFPCL